ncbi:hypothetical protein BD413DRAFT_517267 [Trametes elegans]|nr:hypothetical protein BD413DRAFT_517267 [Trametes elegans]
MHPYPVFTRPQKMPIPVSRNTSRPGRPGPLCVGRHAHPLRSSVQQINHPIGSSPSC